MPPLARELVETVRTNVTIDWTLRENVGAHLRVLVRRILRKYGYPPKSRRRRRRRCWSRPRCCAKGGRRDGLTDAAGEAATEWKWRLGSGREPRALRAPLRSGLAQRNFLSSWYLGNPMPVLVDAE
jgi:hypothetical protein